MTEWNDGRLDDLSKRVDRIETKMDAGFAHVDDKFEALETKVDTKFEALETKFDTKFDEFFSRLDAKFDLVNDRFDNLYGVLFKAACGLVIGLLGLMGVLVGVIAT